MKQIGNTEENSDSYTIKIRDYYDKYQKNRKSIGKLRFS